MVHKNILLIHTRAKDIKMSFENRLGQSVHIHALSLFDIKSVGYKAVKADYYIVTSANAVPFLNDNHQPIIAVGEATREALDRANVPYEEYNLATIADLKTYSHMLQGQKIVHLCGVHQSSDALKIGSDFAIEPVPIYEAVMSQDAKKALRDNLSKQIPDIVALFSPRSAEVFVKHFTDIHDCDTLNNNKALPCAVVISSTVKEALGDVFETIIVADAPARTAMIKAIQNELK